MSEVLQCTRMPVPAETDIDLTDVTTPGETTALYRGEPSFAVIDHSKMKKSFVKGTKPTIMVGRDFPYCKEGACSKISAWEAF